MSGKTTFISYRRDASGIPFARLVHEKLTSRGYDSFLDVDNLVSGNWREQLRFEVSRRAHFLLLLTPGALDDCSDPNDIMRREFELAVATGRNIVGIFNEGVDLDSLRLTCPAAMKQVFSYQLVELRHTSFPAQFERLVHDFIPPHKAPSDPAGSIDTGSHERVGPSGSPNFSAAPTKTSLERIVHLTIDFLLIAAAFLTLFQGMNGDWRAALSIPIIMIVKGWLLAIGLSGELRYVAFVALIAFVSGSAIVAGALRAKRDLRTVWGMVGLALLGLSVGASLALATVQAKRRNKSTGADT